MRGIDELDHYELLEIGKGMRRRSRSIVPIARRGRPMLTIRSLSTRFSNGVDAAVDS